MKGKRSQIAMLNVTVARELLPALLKQRQLSSQYKPSPECPLRCASSCIPFSGPQHFHLTSSVEGQNMKIQNVSVSDLHSNASHHKPFASVGWHLFSTIHASGL